MGVQRTWAQAERNLVLADGRPDRRNLGYAVFEIKSLPERAPCPVIFAPEESLYLLGATALENFGLTVDPVGKRLKPILAVIGGFRASADDPGASRKA